MFQDEARFGRITDPSSCWAPKGIRPTVHKQIIREYTYAYGAFSPLDGESDSLILPRMDTINMSIFLDEVSVRHPNEHIGIIMDGAPCHTSGELKIPDNIRIIKLPPYSPELNPSENMWDEMREKWFGNCVFNSMNAVEKRMVQALQAIESDPQTVKSITGWNWILSSI